MKKNKRPQRQKDRRSPEHQQRVLDLRAGNAAQPHRSKTDYRRKPKHGGWELA